MSMKKTCGYNFFILCIFMVFGWNSENTKINLNDITVENMIHCSNGKTVPVRVLNYDLINQKIFNNNKKSEDLTLDSVLKGLEERLNDENKVQFNYLYDYIGNVIEEIPKLNEHSEVIKDEAVTTIIKERILNGIKDLYLENRDDKILQKIDLFTKVIDVTTNKKLHKPFIMSLSSSSKYYYTARGVMCNGKDKEGNYEITMPLYGENGKKWLVDTMSLMHEMGHIIFLFIFGEKLINDNNKNDKYQEYDVFCKNGDIIDIHNDFLKKLLGMNDAFYSNHLYKEIFGEFYRVIELIEVVGIFEFEKKLFINPYSEVSLHDNAKRANGVWYSNCLGCILDTPDETIKSDYFKFLGLNDEQIQKRKNDTVIEERWKKFYNVFKKCEEQMQHVNLPVERQFDFFMSLSSDVINNCSELAVRNNLINNTITYLGIIGTFDKCSEERDLLTSVLKLFVKNDKTKKIKSLKCDTLQCNLSSVDFILEEFDHHKITKDELIKRIKRYAENRVYDYKYEMRMLEDLKQVKLEHEFLFYINLEKARDIFNEKINLGNEFKEKIKSLIDNTNSNDFYQQAKQLKQDIKNLTTDFKLLQYELYQLLDELI